MLLTEPKICYIIVQDKRRYTIYCGFIKYSLYYKEQGYRPVRVSESFVDCIEGMIYRDYKNQKT